MTSTFIRVMIKHSTKHRYFNNYYMSNALVRIMISKLFYGNIYIFSSIKPGESVCIVIAISNGIKISHNYLRQKALRWPLPVCNCQAWVVCISVAQWNNIHCPFAD